MSDENDITRKETGFPSTHWSMVLGAVKGGTLTSEQRLEEFWKRYWYPIYAFYRRCGQSPDDAKDLTQAFAAHLLEHNSLESVKEGGRFRSFLLTLAKRFMLNEHQKAKAQKRGCGYQILSADQADSEIRYTLEPVENVSPDQLFDRAYAVRLLDSAFNALEKEYSSDSKSESFRVLFPYLSGADRTIPYSEAASKLGVTESNIKVLVHRLRRRYGELLHQEVRQTVTDPSAVATEIQEIMQAFSKK